MSLFHILSNSIIWGSGLLTLALFNNLCLAPLAIKPSRNPDSSVTNMITKVCPRFLGDLTLANRTISYLHCNLIFFSGLYLKWSPDQGLVNHLIMCSGSYFLMDLFYVFTLEYDYTFILHHTACILLCSSCLIFNIGKDLLVGGLFLAETTGLLWIPWEASSKFGWNRLRSELSVPFMIIYTIIRGFYFPYYLIKCIPKILVLGVSPLVRVGLIISVILLAMGGIIWTPKIIKKCIKYRLNCEDNYHVVNILDVDNRDKFNGHTLPVEN